MLWIKHELLFKNKRGMTQQTLLYSDRNQILLKNRVTN